MKLLLEKIKKAYKEELPFVVYNKPNDTTVFGLFQRNDTLYNITSDFNKSGFVFAPFNSSETTILFPLEHSEFIKTSFVNQYFKFKKELDTNNSSNSEHVKIVQKAIDAIKNDKFKKVVISRKEIVALDGVVIEDVYNKLLQKYPNAFVYAWFHPKIGLWFGASPETLLQIDKNTFSTMALAGTQVYNNTENVAWQQKEIDEQWYVTKFIKEQITPIVTAVKVAKTKTVKAGSLLHLKTQITGVFNEKTSLKEFINALHPTPAVCGFPKNEAKDFILKNESYKRTYYTGFLGELNLVSERKTHLFVNLRCMQIKDKNAVIFVGGGITKESNALKEWQETVAKAQVMKSVLQ